MPCAAAVTDAEREAAAGALRLRRRPALRRHLGAANVGMRTIHVPHSDIPRNQVGHTEGEPDAVVERLGHVYGVVRSWLGAST